MIYTLTFRIWREPRVRCIVVDDLAHASRAYRDATRGLGMSECSEGLVRSGTRRIARVSYNGRVWGPKPWRPGDEPIMEASE